MHNIRKLWNTIHVYKTVGKRLKRTLLPQKQNKYNTVELIVKPRDIKNKMIYKPSNQESENLGRRNSKV